MSLAWYENAPEDPGGSIDLDAPRKEFFGEMWASEDRLQRRVGLPRATDGDYEHALASPYVPLVDMLLLDAELAPLSRLEEYHANEVRKTIPVMPRYRLALRAITRHEFPAERYDGFGNWKIKPRHYLEWRTTSPSWSFERGPLEPEERWPLPKAFQSFLDSLGGDGEDSDDELLRTHDSAVDPQTITADSGAEIVKMNDAHERSPNDARKTRKGRKRPDLAEANASRREEVLGAALACLAAWPELCRNKRGRVNASAILRTIEDKARLFWPGELDPPMARDVIVKKIRFWLKKAR